MVDEWRFGSWILENREWVELVFKNGMDVGVGCLKKSPRVVLYSFTAPGSVLCESRQNQGRHAKENAKR